MTRDHRQAAGAGALLKLLASYLVAVLLLQGLAAAFALGAGPLHRHRGAPTSTAVALFSHAEQHVAQRAEHHAQHHHGSNQRHHHGAGDSTVALDAAAQEAADSAALALTAALSLLAVQTPRVQADNRSHVQHAAPLWFWYTVLTLPLARPPSQG